MSPIGTHKIHWEKGLVHAEDKPAVILYFKTGTLESEIYCRNGLWHREDKPAITNYYQSGKVKSEYFYVNGRLHRNGKTKPAIIWYDEEGSVIKTARLKNGSPYFIDDEDDED